MLSTIFLLLVNTPALYATSNTFLIGEIECSCSGASAVCSGDSEDGEEEIKDVFTYLLQNCSSTNDLLSLTFNINADKWPNLSFKQFKLQNLTLGYGLEVLNEDSFYGLNSSLLSLNLSHNDIEFFYTKHSPFSILENLKVLNLDYNELTEFREDIFENLTTLEIFTISGNGFTGLHSNLLENMTVIQTLVLDHNKRIVSLSDVNLFSSTLAILSAKNCSFNGSLETDTLSGVPNLKYVDLSSNHLSQVNAFALEKLHNLESLNLSGNEIETLKNYSFSSLNNLVELDLKSNEISVIEEYSFANLTQLKILNLANNKLYGFLKNYASDLHSLEKINLENNDIHYIESDSFSIAIQLKELLLRGNAFACWHCDTMYIAGLLTNDTLLKKEDIDAIICSEPEEMKNWKLASVTPENLEDYCDPIDSSSDTPSTDVTLAFSTSTEASNSSSSHTEDPSSSIDSTLSEKKDTSAFPAFTIPQNTSESSDTTSTTILESTSVTTPILIPHSTSESADDATSETTTTYTTTRIKDLTVSLNFSETNTTIETSSVLYTESETETVTKTTTETSTKSVFPSSDTTFEKEETRVNSTTDLSVFPVSEYTTAGSIGKAPLSSSEPTTDLTTEELIEITTSTTAEMVTTSSQSSSTSLLDVEETTISATTSLPSIITETPSVSIQTGFVTTASLDDTEMTTKFIIIQPKKLSGSELIHITDNSISNDTICVKYNIKFDVLLKRGIKNVSKCGIEIQHTTGKEVRPFKSCPTSKSEMQDCVIFENKYLRNMYKFCINLYILNEKLKSCSKFDYPATTTEKSIIYSSTTQQFLLPTPATFVPFKVVEFEANFNYTKSVVDVHWVVNRNEKNAICTLSLILMSHNFNYTESVFSCKNNSYKILNIKQESFQVCLRNFYRGYYAPLMCKSSEPFSYQFSTASMKDDGYKNSPLIAVICLLILIVLIVIVILLKKIIKKRSESDLYNVSAEEKNVIRRQASASLRQDPCVRYSYTLREQMEI